MDCDKSGGGSLNCQFYHTTADKSAKEGTMDIADILIHVHPDLLAEQREKLEEALNSKIGRASCRERV